MIEQARHAIDACLRISTMTEEPGRITRRFLTAPVRDVHEYLRGRMTEMGMDVGLDAVGNLRGTWKNLEAKRRILLGSHIDTVRNAGPFDGVLGVTMALEWVELARQHALPLEIEVVAFSEEEGVRFGVPFIGSRAVAGRFDPGLLDLRDSDGVSVQDAIRQFGLDPAEIDAARMDERVAAYFEVHIEQGPVLEAEGLSVAAVGGILGQTRLGIQFRGQQNHAGTTPMQLRRDALAGAAEWISGIEKVISRVDGMVATVGQIEVEPNVSNVVPGKARASLDVRHIHDMQRRSTVNELTETAAAIAERRGLELSIETRLNEPAVSMDERLTAYLVEAMEAQDLTPRIVNSGAGHDAMVFAARVPSAMLFVRSPRGISHDPAETVRDVDVEAALKVGFRFLQRIAAETAP